MNKVPWTRLYKQGSTNKVLRTRTTFKRRSCYSPTSSQAKVLVEQASAVGYLTRFAIKYFFSTIRSRRENEEITTDKPRTRTTFQRVLNQEFFFGSWVAVFSRDPSCLKYWLLGPFFYKEATCKSSTIKGQLYAAKAAPSKDYFTHLTLTNARKGRWVISPDYRASYPWCFCAVGDVVAQRYDALRDWLWDACHMAGVRWGSHCKGFCSKEGPHYRLEWSARKLS
jgi:hypothetical protein